MKITTIIVLLTFTISSVCSCWLPVLAQEKEPPKLTLGIIPFQASGVKDYEAVTLSNRLHSELVKTKQMDNSILFIKRKENNMKDMKISKAYLLLTDKVKRYLKNMKTISKPYS